MHVTDEKRSGFRAPVVAAAVVGLHVVVLVAVLSIQGCSTKQVAEVAPPPPPVMPPRQDVSAPHSLPPPAFNPPVEKAPASLQEAAPKTYVVASGDSLSRIAARHGVTAREIAELNQIKNPNSIRVGQKLLLPSYADAVTAAPAPKPQVKKSEKPAAVAGAGEYVVKSGDSLSKIAARNGTSVGALRDVNGLKSDVIRIGQKIKLPAGASAKAKAEPEAKPAAPPTPAPAPAVEATPAPAPVAATPVAVPPAPESVAPLSPIAPAVETAVAASELDSVEVPFEYPVKPGETLDDIARNFGVVKGDLLSLNGMKADAKLAPGQRIKIPMPSP